MWSIFIWSVVCLLLNDGWSLESHSSLRQSSTMLVASIPDTEYEQVIAERYLFAPFANESTAWSVLSTVRRAWQVTSLPQYHLQATEGVWLLTQTTTEALKISW
ncbi:unnamed protein product, partial [Adineta steineri]